MLSETMKRKPTGDIKLIMGDFDAKVGNRSTAPVTGDNGLGEVNSNGESLMEFCMEQRMRLVNTWHKQHPRKLYTWTSPDDKTKNQIDYIGRDQSWSSCIRNCKTYPGADCDTDHNLLVATMKIRLNWRKKSISKRLDLEKLYGKQGLEYMVEVKNRFEVRRKDPK